VSHGLVTVLETLNDVLRTLNEYEEASSLTTKWPCPLDHSRSTTSNRPRMCLRLPCPSIKGLPFLLDPPMFLFINLWVTIGTQFSSLSTAVDNRLCRTATCGPVPGGKIPGSRSWSRETVTRVSPMLTGAPNKVRGTSAQPASE
jgi:hypothetical protein